MESLPNRTQRVGRRSPMAAFSEITIHYKGRHYPAGADLPGAETIHWWVEYTVISLEGGLPGIRAAQPRALRPSLREAVHYARWLVSRGRPDIRKQIRIYPVDRSLRETAG